MIDWQAFADDWYRVWNAHDLEAILAHYAPDVTFRSPYVKRFAPDSGGVLRGRDQLRPYFGRAFEVFPALRFEPFALCVGVDSATLIYRAADGRTAAETMVVQPDGLIADVRAQYTAA